MRTSTCASPEMRARPWCCRRSSRCCLLSIGPLLRRRYRYLHGFRFEVVNIDGVAPTYRALQDTINIGAEQTVRLLVPVEGHPGTWMFHCHILEHAERGMMGELDVREPQ
jgi:hypothetical protein